MRPLLEAVNQRNNVDREGRLCKREIYVLRKTFTLLLASYQQLKYS
jgi:hypothetical protein